VRAAQKNRIAVYENNVGEMIFHRKSLLWLILPEIIVVDEFAVADSYTSADNTEWSKRDSILFFAHGASSCDYSQYFLNFRLKTILPKLS
jgi:hypothetical protein